MDFKPIWYNLLLSACNQVSISLRLSLPVIWANNKTFNNDSWLKTLHWWFSCPKRLQNWCFMSENIWLKTVGWCIYIVVNDEDLLNKDPIIIQLSKSRQLRRNSVEILSFSYFSFFELDTTDWISLLEVLLLLLLRILYHEWQLILYEHPL